MLEKFNNAVWRTAELGAFFNRVGVLLNVVNAIDKQAYEYLIKAANLDDVANLFEVGCGRGYLAEKILKANSNIARYIATEASAENVRSSTARLAAYPSFQCEFVDGSLPYRFPNNHFDVVVSCYVLDCMHDHRCQQEIEELRRILRPNGRLYLLSVTKGETPISIAVSSFWSLLYSISPWLTGGSRVVSLASKFESGWKEIRSNTVDCYGFASELAMARKV